MLKNWKSQKGYTGIDVAISISILSIFILIISTIFANIYVQYTEAQRDSVAMSYLTSTSELIDKMYYQHVYIEEPEDPADNENLGKRLIAIFGPNTSITRNSAAHKLEAIISNNYKITIIINKHNPEGADLVKNVDIEVSYKIGEANKSLKINKVKAKEILITPNRPQLPSKVVASVPVKFIITDFTSGEGFWEITSENDSTWYNYDNKMWANIMLEQGLTVEGGITVTEDNKNTLIGKKVINPTAVFTWIPKFAVSNDELVFLYSTTNNYVDANGFLQKCNTTANAVFNDITGFWVAMADYSGIENISEITPNQYSIVVNGITASQKSAVLSLSQSKYGTDKKEFKDISDNRKTIIVK